MIFQQYRPQILQALQKLIHYYDHIKLIILTNLQT